MSQFQDREVKSLKTCACGCGGSPRTTNAEFLAGHNLRMKITYRVDLNSGCWVWQGPTSTTNGYGRIQRAGRRILAHRYFYEIANGPVPEGLDLDHLCRNRACVNPDHLEPVTRAENVRRGPHTKLDHEKVAAIRASTSTHVELAKQYGVTPTCIQYAREGKSWVKA